MASNSVGAASAGETVLRIVPSKGWVSLQLGEVWQYRELLYFMVWRDIKIRYKQTALGASWAIIQPLMTMVVFSMIFGKVAKMPTYGIPYALFSFAALVPWTFFANGLSNAANGLITSANLIKKVYFPRLTIPIASVLSGIVDFALAFSVLLLMMLGYHVRLTVNLVWLPLFLLLALSTSLGVGLWLSAMNVKYRDVRQIVPFVVQLWFYASPVVWSSEMLHEPWRTLSGINPMAGVVEGFRWALLGSLKPAAVVAKAGAAAATHARSSIHAPDSMIWVSVAVSLFILVTGAYYFRRMEKTFADLV